MTNKGETKQIQVSLVRSAIRRPENQKRVLNGLGLRRINKVKSLQDTKEIRGMINKVKHLIKIVE